MRVLSVYTPGLLRQETIDALCRNWPAELTDLVSIPASDPRAYGKILADYWNHGESFMVVEPDIVVREDVMDAFTDCKCEYGCFPYSWLTDVGPALGCTWFHSPFLAKHPTAMMEVLAENVSWRQLDVTLMRKVLARGYSEQPHVHLPAVEHLNEKQQLLPNASIVPLTTVPHW